MIYVQRLLHHHGLDLSTWFYKAYLHTIIFYHLLVGKIEHWLTYEQKKIIAMKNDQAKINRVVLIYQFLRFSRQQSRKSCLVSEQEFIERIHFNENIFSHTIRYWSNLAYARYKRRKIILTSISIFLITVSGISFGVSVITPLQAHNQSLPVLSDNDIAIKYLTQNETPSVIRKIASVAFLPKASGLNDLPGRNQKEGNGFWEYMRKTQAETEILFEESDIPTISEQRLSYSPDDMEDIEITVEAVLVPKQKTVISSSRDGRIKNIPFKNGDRFKEGDILVEYDCEDLQAEKKIAESRIALLKKTADDSKRLFQLKIISDLELRTALIEYEQAEQRLEIANKRLNGCFVRAEYDGRIVNRLANPNEYTRTDRVLMEIASLDSLNAELLIPSKWLRFVNVGAPLTIYVNETDRIYEAEISNIFGEVDPVSQSIQIVAGLKPYDTILLPGMSGQATLNINDIRAAGIIGLLEQ